MFVANSPQVILSAIYYTYNGLWTTFCTGLEWSRYSRSRKGLRVSTDPRGSQRSSYFLELPYRIAIPLLVLSGVLHWLTSQSLFLVSVLEMNTAAGGRNTEFLTCGYSASALLSVVIIGGVMVAAFIIAGFWRIKGDIPVAGTCSAAISAACHLSSKRPESIELPGIYREPFHLDVADTVQQPDVLYPSESTVLMPAAKPCTANARTPASGATSPGAPGMEKVETTSPKADGEDGEDAVYLPLKWGATEDETRTVDGRLVGHCGFSSRHVKAPEEGKRYS